MVETDKRVKAAITKRLDKMSGDDLGRVLQFVESVGELPRGLTGAEMMEFAGTMTHEDAEEMMRIIEEGCEQVDLSAW